MPVGDGRDGDYDVFLWRTSDPTYPGGRPHILWPEASGGRGARQPGALVVTSEPAVEQFATDSGVAVRLVPRLVDTGREARPIAPFVRARIRAARGRLSMRSPQTAMGGPGPVSASRTDWQTQRSP